jgi:hypothetical protein
MRLLLNLAMTLLLAGTVGAQTKSWNEEPYEFRGLSFGLASESEAAQAIPLHCRPGLTAAERICDEKGFRFGNAMSDYSLHFLNGYLEGVILTFKLEDYAAAREAFIDKYGKPHEETDSTVKDKAGNDAEQETLRWSGKSIEIYLTRLASTFGRSSATIGSTTFWKYVADLTESRKGQ